LVKSCQGMVVWLAVVGSVLPVQSAVSARAGTHFVSNATPEQLPKTVVPLAYTIDLTPDLKTLNLRGHESVRIMLAAPTDTLVLNQAGLKLAAATVDGIAARVTQDETRQTATFQLPQPLKAGEHTLVVDYTGPILQTPNGIYYNDYTDHAGQRRRMLVTQFEVADARRMFPGWDEPSFKARFTLSVTLPDDLVPLSNMPVATAVPAGEGLRRTTFQTTPRMSTYLLALVAARLASSGGRADGTPVRTYAPAGQEADGTYATQSAVRILPYYNSYFGVRYPLPKLDMIAIPGNYEAGAMENWGAITFIDDAVLYNPQHSAPATKERVFLVVAHEMAHQWSGDLVTMAWWNDLWLNEGFATWMETHALDRFNPTWEIWPRQHEDRERAMAQDALPTTHPIQHPIHDISEASSAFDSISYQKGSQVIRMLESWLGQDTFRAGMRRYMKAHAYGNATSEDLWSALSAVSGRNVGAVARTFTEQPGIPLVQVARRCVAGRSVLTLRQERFTIHDPFPQPLVWQVPVVAGGPGLPLRRAVLGKEPVSLSFPGCRQAITVNAGENGYYRAQYDASGLAALRTGFARLGAAERANVLGDQFALFEAGRAPLSEYLSFLAVLPVTGERSTAVWQEALTHLLQIDRMERDTPSRAAFRAFARSVLAPVFARLGWEENKGEALPESMLRPQIISALATLNDPNVIAEGLKRFDAWQRHPASLPSALVGPVAGIAGQYGSSADFDALVRLLRQAPDTEGRLRLFAALARTHDPEQVVRAATLATDGSIPNGRIVRALAQLARESEQPEAVWRIVLARQAVIRQRLTPGGQAVLLPAVAAQSADPAIGAALMADSASRASTGARHEARQAEEQIAQTAELTRRTHVAVADWLATLAASPATAPEGMRAFLERLPSRAP
jgi:aminopeptidase N